MDPSILARLKAEAKRQRRSAAFIAEIILDENLPKDNWSGTGVGHQPDPKGDTELTGRRGKG